MDDGLKALNQQTGERAAALMSKVLEIASSAIRAEITAQLVAMYRGVVQSGPFAGMKLPLEASWGDGDLAPKMLGCYEQELHEAIEKAIERKPDAVINIGSAEGYYAVGLSRRLPGVHTIAMDKSAEAQAICRLASAMNQDADVDSLQGECDPDVLIALALTGSPGAQRSRMCARPLVIMDVEGGELDILTPDAITHFRHCDLIIECHDFVKREISFVLWNRLSASHDCVMVYEGPRNPNQYPALARLNSLARWIAVCENRPETMSWIVAWARR